MLCSITRGTRRGQPRDLVTWSQVQPAGHSPIAKTDHSARFRGHDPFANRNNHKPACKRKQTKHTQRIERCCAYSERYLRSPSGVHARARALAVGVGTSVRKRERSNCARSRSRLQVHARAAEGHH